MNRFKRWIARYWLWVIFGAVIVAFAWSEIRQGQQQEQISNQQEQISDTVHKVARLTVANRALTTSLQAAIVESCQRIGNQRARVQREQINEEIREAEHPDPVAFHALVKVGIPPKVIRESEQKEIVRLEGQLHRIKLTPCAQQYHIGPGSAPGRRVR